MVLLVCMFVVVVVCCCLFVVVLFVFCVVFFFFFFCCILLLLLFVFIINLNSQFFTASWYIFLYCVTTKRINIFVCFCFLLGCFGFF